MLISVDSNVRPRAKIAKRSSEDCVDCQGLQKNWETK